MLRRHRLLVGIGVSDLYRQNFNSHVTTEFRVACAIYFAHPTRTKLLADFVAAEFRAWRQTHRFRPAIQFTTMLIGVALVSSIIERMRKR